MLELVEKYVGFEFDDFEFELAEPKARRKLENIIKREGDSNGERLKGYYLAQLIAEQIKQTRVTMHCMDNFEKKYKKRSA